MQKTVKLPPHLWSALDEMSAEAAQAADALVEMAVEQFVALQGYEIVAERPERQVTMPIPPAPEPAPPEEDFDLARTAARPALQTGEEPAAERDVPIGVVPTFSGFAPTHVPMKGKGQQAVKAEALPPPEPEPSVIVTDMNAAYKPEPLPEKPPPPVPTAVAPAPAPPVAAPAKPSAPGRAKAVPVPPPAWVTRAALSDADEERVAAREHLVAIDADLEKLTIERPTTTPLGGASEDEE